jgi:hypothetical protein
MFAPLERVVPGVPPQHSATLQYLSIELPKAVATTLEVLQSQPNMTSNQWTPVLSRPATDSSVAIKTTKYYITAVQKELPVAYVGALKEASLRARTQLKFNGYRGLSHSSW